jgi:Spy/CpxP family protein refolding chaperone
MKTLTLRLGLLVLVVAAPAFAQKPSVLEQFVLQEKIFQMGLQKKPTPVKKADPLSPLQLAFRGTFWRDPDWVSRLGLTPDQTKKMEETFRQYRLKLIDISATLEKDELFLTPMIEALPEGDGTKLAAQIDKVADSRAELEKTNSKMLISILQILTQAQWAKLREKME